MMEVVICILTYPLAWLSVKGFLRYLYPKLAPFRSIENCKPFTCEKCMVFWLTISSLGVYNYITGYSLLTALFYLIISFINYKIYENVKRKLLQ